jgi:hypothetical protein
MRVMILSLLLIAVSAVRPAVAEDERGCSVRAGSFTATKASFPARVSFRQPRVAFCPRETRPLTPSCFPATAMLTQ